MRAFILCFVALAASSASAFTIMTPKLLAKTITRKTTIFKMSAEPEQTLTSRRSVVWTSFVSIAAVVSVAANNPQEAQARLEPVNRPDLLPKESNQNIIQIEKYLTSGEAKRMDQLLTKLENDTGFRVRVLCQSYPNTPGLAITNYWDLGKEGQKDDKYIVLVVDQFGGKANALNFNVGEGVKFALPNVFWSRLQAKYGSTFYVKDKGIDMAIVNAIDAIVNCLRSENQYCVSVPDEGFVGKGFGL